MSADPRLPHDADPDDDPRLPWPQELFRRVDDVEKLVYRLTSRQASTDREQKIVRWLIGIGLPAMMALFVLISRGGA